MLRLWCLLLIAIALGCGAVSARHGRLHRTVVELGDPLLMHGRYIIIEQRQEPSWSVTGAISSLGKQIKDGISQAFWSGVRFWDQVWRHEREMFTRTTGLILGKNHLFKGSPGATEPLGVIPEPPTMHYKSRLHHAVAATVEQFVKLQLPIPADSSCTDALEEYVTAIKTLLSKNLASICAKPGGRCAHKFCHRLAKDREAVLNRVLAMSFIDPVQLALTRLGSCRDGQQLERALSQTINIRDRFISQVPPSHVKPLLDGFCGPVSVTPDACRLRDESPHLFKTILLYKAPMMKVHIFFVRHGPLRRAPASATIPSNEVKKVPAEFANHAAPVLRAEA